MLPRSIATMDAFENAMSVDIAMGGSTNTVLHLLASAHEGNVPFTMKDIDRLSRKVPHLCKVSPSRPDVHMEDMHRAGGIPAIMGELDRLGLLHRDVPMVHSANLPEALKKWDIRAPDAETNTTARDFFRASPGGVRTTEAFSQSSQYHELDMDTENGAIRSGAHAYNQDGGLAVLYGNLAEDGAIVKTAGVAAGLETFSGPARIFESQDAAVSAILGDKIKPGDVVLIRYEGPKGGPGVILSQLLMQTSASAQCAFTIYSTASAISSREGRLYNMPPWPMAMPSSTAMVLNSRPIPPASAMDWHTSWPISLRCTWPGTNWVKELATAIMGLPKSESFIPVARHRLRAPAMLRPCVVVRDL